MNRRVVGRSIRIAALWVLVAAAGAVGYEFGVQSFQHVGRVFAEGCIYAALFGALMAVRPVRASWDRLPSRLRLVAVGVLAVLVLGQLLKAPRYTFPFPTWDMYSGKIVAAEVYRFRAHTVGATDTLLDPEHAFPAVGDFRLAQVLQNLSRTVASEAPHSSFAEAGLKETLWVLADELERDEPGTIVDAIEVEHCVLTFAERVPEESCALLRRYEVDASQP